MSYCTVDQQYTSTVLYAPCSVHRVQQSMQAMCQAHCSRVYLGSVTDTPVASVLDTLFACSEASCQVAVLQEATRSSKICQSFYTLQLSSVKLTQLHGTLFAQY